MCHGFCNIGVGFSAFALRKKPTFLFVKKQAKNFCVKKIFKRLVFLLFLCGKKPTFLFVKKQVSAFRRQKSAGEHNAETRDIVYSKTNFGERESCTQT